MRAAYLKKLLLILFICLFSFSLAPSHGDEDPSKTENSRNRLISYMLNNNLGKYHFSKKKIDDELSKAAFRLYIKQLDPQKRYLLAGDLKLLKTYENRIDEEMKTSNIQLPDKAAEILNARLPVIREMVREILSQDFDFTTKETIETDPEKLEFCSSTEELRERWRKTLKYQVLHRYLNLLEDEKAAMKEDRSADAKPAAPATVSLAREKVLKGYETAFTRLLHEKARDRYDHYFEAFSRAFDPHSDYMPPSDKEDFDIGMKGQLEGIGATLKEEDGYIKVVSIVPGGPAYRQGSLQPEDIILKVRDGNTEPVEITDMKLRDAIKLIRGKKGTEVYLTVRKAGGASATIALVRDIVQLEDGFVKSLLLKDPASGRPFGYIKIPSFYRDFEKARFGGTSRNSTDDVRKELTKLKAEKIDGLVLDLRNNGGGALTDAVKTAGLFIKTGPVVQVKGLDSRVSVLSDDDPEVVYSGPLIVLVNKFSASASEILAGALQDYGRAIIAGGEHTHGKGTVQTILDLNDDMPFANMEHLKPLGALKLTTQKFYRVTGASTQYKGVTPDIILPDRYAGIKSGEQHMDFALPWDTIGPVAHSRWGSASANTGDLRHKSELRVTKSKEFQDTEELIRKTIADQKNTIRPLTLDEARKEIEEARAFRERESSSAHGKAAADRKKNRHLSEEEKKGLWSTEVNDDPYVRESIAMLDDLLASSPSVTAK